MTLVIQRVIVDALGLPSSAAQLSKRSEMSCVTRHAIIEAEMAFSDVTGRIDGISYRSLSSLILVKLPYRILENS